MIAYLDSSVLLRLLLKEPNALRELDELERGVTSALTQVEILRTLDRLQHRRQLSDRGLAAMRQRAHAVMEAVDVIELSPPVLRRAGDPFPTPVRTLDAIHVASALVFRDFGGAASLAFATHDTEQAECAGSLGFQVLGAVTGS
jgi:predicted nucleic acid-binding protein